MHQRRHNALAFLLVLLAAVAGAFLARELVGTIEMPELPKPSLATAQQLLGSVDVLALVPRRTPTGRPTAAATGPAPAPRSTLQPLIEQDAAPSPGAPSLATAAPTADAGGSALQPQPSPTAPPTPAPPTPTPTASTPSTAYPFRLAGAVRNTAGDCPGASIRGAVRDSAGNLLPGVRLWRYDQWGNEQVVETKSGEQDLGQYDFPLSDTPNVHYVQVVDNGGAIISPVVEVPHRQGDAADATCHWIDWVRQ